MIYEHPWQETPSELLQHAIHHFNKNSGSNDRIAFLLTDVAVETILKTFLLLPNTITGDVMKYQDRMKCCRGRFHEFLEAAFTHGRERLKVEDPSHIKYFHNIRNKLYHEGDGVSIGHQTVKKYLTLATKLLVSLLEVDLNSLLHAQEDREKYAQLVNLLNDEIQSLKTQIVDQHEKLNFHIKKYVERLGPNILLPSFVTEWHSIMKEYLVVGYSHEGEKGLVLTNNAEKQLELINKLSELVCRKLEDTETINQLLTPTENLPLEGVSAETIPIIGTNVLSCFNKPEKIFWHILDVINFHDRSDWYFRYEFTSWYPSLIPREEGETEEEFLNRLIAEGKEQLQVLTEMVRD